MMTENFTGACNEIIAQFQIEGSLLTALPYGEGHINDTFLAEFDPGENRRKKYIVQRINTDIFQNVEELMQNILGVTSYLREKIALDGGNPDRETLTVIPTRKGTPYYAAPDGSCWRCYLYIERTVTFQQVAKPEDFYSVAKAFGRFQMQMAGYPAFTLYEVIPDFHNTPNRLLNFRRAVEQDPLGRAAAVRSEIEFILQHAADTNVLTHLLEEGKLPLRVTHNDTKLNNILFDADTGKGLCVIDLDTVMPGLVHYDFGDSIRFGASTAAEDEQDLSKVSLDLTLYELFTSGYLETAGRVFTPLEKETLPWGALLMTLECGMRFLTDYLEGDVYFKIQREGQNLDRSRTQLRLAADMKAKWDDMCAITAKYS